jgi:hypothetical protein
LAGLVPASALAATPAPKVVFFGDATTAFLSLNQQWPSNWINAGVVNPETTAQELARFPEVLSLHPNILHIIPGIGDISAIDYTNQDFVIPQIEANVTAMIAEAKRANIKVGLDPKFETLRNRDNCSERRFGWQQPVFSKWSSELR